MQHRHSGKRRGRLQAGIVTNCELGPQPLGHNASVVQFERNDEARPQQGFVTHTGPGREGFSEKRVTDVRVAPLQAVLVRHLELGQKTVKLHVGYFSVTNSFSDDNPSGINGSPDV